MAARPQPEARSLSALNYLAANPPQYPYSPELRESLTLYISRVPGTQDIILSTLRPQRKSVTGEDITNSLYYVHLDSPEDVLLKAAQPPEGAISPRSSGESARSAIPRKPLPVSARGPRPDIGVMNGVVPASLSVPTGLVQQPPSPRNTAPPPISELQPVQGGAVEGYRVNPMFQKRRPGNPPDLRASTASPAPSAAPFQRKALNPRSPSPLFGSDGTPQPQFNARPPGRPVTPTYSSLAPHPNGQTEHIAPPTSPLYRDRTPSPGPVVQSASSVTFSLTIIRRDPTSGAQYNIGKVSSFQTNVPTPDSADPNLDPENMGGLLAHAQKIDIRLDSSGYAKYRGLPNRAELDTLRPTSGQSFTQQMMQGTGPGQGGGRGGALKPAWKPVEEGFSRQVVMSYGASWKANFKKAFHRRDRSSSQGNAGNVSPDTAGPPRPFHARHGSASTIGSVDSADGGVSPTLITHPGPGLKPRGYVFLSPWDGRCEFRTSTNGRSLKCRHILDAASMRIDAREVAQSIQNAQAMGRSRGDELSSALVGAKPVSELRFNLPQGALHKANAGGQSKGGLSVHFSKLLQHQSRSSEDESDYDDFVDYNDTPLDLSLGKENAGGGNRGKRAKLGKLIIHDEGLKMLDLIVAANVGVWWNSWSRMM
ncbi:hypothetical protein N0V88_008056 [Collariella sp. IMI 366227]|nr:hypothetical protein N0V88_008056 [Collariella sp. IMI 366227]